MLDWLELLNIEGHCHLMVKPLVAGNGPWWEYIHCINDHMLQIETLFF